MTTWGIFSDDGQLETFDTEREAHEALREDYSPEDEARVARCCDDHPEHEHDTCEPCAAEID